MATDEILQKTRESLARIQQFDAHSLSRVEELGNQLGFAGAVQPAQALINIYKRIPETALEDFSDAQLNTINGQAGADYNLFKSILDFTSNVSDPAGARTNLITQVITRRDALFEQAWQYIAYGVARSTDATVMQTEARALIQSLADQSEKIIGQLNTAKKSADEALEAIREVASEHGVSQQAIYFKTEAEGQENTARKWLISTFVFAVLVWGFAVGSLLLHKWEWIQPATRYEAIQLITSKFLIFAVLGYMLVVAVKNYTSHKHNAVVNRHRENALKTYRAVVEASGEKGTQDIILIHASSCIFSPQETGFSNSRGEISGMKPVLEILSKGATKSAE